MFIHRVPIFLLISISKWTTFTVEIVVYTFYSEDEYTIIENSQQYTLRKT